MTVVRGFSGDMRGYQMSPGADYHQVSSSRLAVPFTSYLVGDVGGAHTSFAGNAGRTSSKVDSIRPARRIGSMWVLITVYGCTDHSSARFGMNSSICGI